MSKNYIITDGKCSDYHICAVFDNRELAEKIVNKFGGQIEEWELNLSDMSEMLLKNNIYRVQMNEKGESIIEEVKDHYFYIEKIQQKGDIGFNYSIWDENNRWFTTYVVAKDEKQAIKIANERRIMLLTQNLL